MVKQMTSIKTIEYHLCRIDRAINEVLSEGKTSSTRQTSARDPSAHHEIGIRAQHKTEISVLLEEHSRDPAVAASIIDILLYIQALTHTV